MSTTLHDLRFSLRQLRKAPGVSLAAVVCIALGIGANTATFSFTNSLLLYDPPARDPDRLVRLFVRWDNGLEFGSFSYPDFVDFRDRSEVLSALIAESPRPVHVSAASGNERAWASLVSGNYFSELGITPPLGRGFTPEEDAPGSAPAAVLSHSLWQTRFGSDPGIVGRSMTLNGQPVTVVGVAPEGFHSTNVGFGPDLWVPITQLPLIDPGSRQLENRDSHWITFVIGRLRPGVGPAEAEESLEALMGQLTEEYPDNRGKHIDVYPEAEANLHPMVRGAFIGFMGLMSAVVALILLLACANVAGLLLARSSARRKEIGVRLALGASRGRLLRQLLTESLLLALAAGAVGVLLGTWLIRLLEAIEPPSALPMSWEVGLDGTVLAFTLAITILTGIVFGLAPALQATRGDLVHAIKEGATEGRRSSRLRRGMVVAQVALSLILLIAAGLAVRSLQNVADIDVGFEPDNQLVGNLGLGLQGYDREEAWRFANQLRERLEGLAGVEAVGFAAIVPLTLFNQQWAAIPSGYETPPGSSDPSIDVNQVDHGYFEAMGVPIVRGRGFRPDDRRDGPAVIVVNETFARRFWPGEDPIGKRVQTGGRDHEVVGIADDGKYWTIGEPPRPYMYVPIPQFTPPSFFLHVRTAGDPVALLGPVRRQVEALEPDLPVGDLRTMTATLSFALLPARLAAGVVSVFGVLALLLAAVGLYGVVSFTVTHATREIGLRMALGASTGDVVRLVLRQGMTMTGIGLLLGLAGGVGLSWAVSGLLYGVSSTEPDAFAAALATLCAVALAANLLPARRAVRVDPIVALRSE